MKNVLFLFLFFAGIMMTGSCSKDVEKLREEQQIEITEYMAEKGLTGEKLPSGIWYVITDEGTGVDHPTSTSSVTVHYEGRLLDGKKFDSSYDRGTPFTSSLQSVIVGWQLGIPLFKKGGKGILIIPSEYAYGSSNQGLIPGNSVLVFDIELIDFN